MQSRITGGIVTYNNADIIKPCIESILKWTRDCNFQLYVFDNCSSDNTVDIVSTHFTQVIVIRSTKNVGFGKGHNQIIKKIKSDYHAIINPDIFLQSNCILEMAEFLEMHSDVVQITPEIRNLDGSIQYLPKLDPSFKFVILSKIKPFTNYRKIYTREGERINTPTEILSSTGCLSVIRTKILKDAHGYDPRFFMYFEDADLSRRIRISGKIIYHPGIWACHAWKRDNTRSMKGICIFLSSMWKYHRKWG